MKKLSVALMTLASLLAFPRVSLAGCSDVSCKDVTIDRLYAASDVLYIGTSDDEKKLNCSPTSNVYLTLPTSHSNYDLISAILVTAHESRHPIWIRIGQGSNGCNVSYVVSDK